jgi:EthD domain
MACKILLFMKRKPGMSMAAFKDYYENHHVTLAMANSGGQGGGIARYMRRYLTPLPHAESGTNDELPYDVVSELWFEDEAIFRGTVAYLSTTVMNDAVLTDELNLFHRPTMRMAVVEECETDIGVRSESPNSSS